MSKKRKSGSTPKQSVKNPALKSTPKKKEEVVLSKKAKIISTVIAVVVVLVIAFFVIRAITNNADKKVDTTGESNAQTTETTVLPLQSEGVDAVLDTDVLHHAEIDIEGYGVIYVELDETVAPVSVGNFINLAKSGFYDGLTFHRIMDGFMMQGGDPNGDGTGGSGTNIAGEFEENGFKNPILHERGTISMARGSSNDSASSQFFIMQADNTSLDGKYAAFGWVTAGIEVVDQICKDAEPIDNNGSIASDAQPVIKSVTVID